jgi:hypothetical protein
MPGTNWIKSVEIAREGSAPLTVSADRNGHWKGTDGNLYWAPSFNKKDGSLTLESVADYTTTFYKANGEHVLVPGERAEKLYQSLRHEMYDGIFPVNASAVLKTMENAATPEDLKVVNRMFADRKHLSLDGHLNNATYMSNDSRRDKAKAMLYPEDGAQNARRRN